MANWHGIWSSLDRSSREAAALAFWESDEHPGSHEHAFRTLASHGGFRRRTLERMPLANRARRLAATSSPPAALAQDLVRSLYLGPWLPCLSDLLDHLGLAHEQGRLVQEIADIPPPGEAAALEALRATRDRHGAERTDTLAAALSQLYPELYAALPPALAKLQEQPAAPEAPAPETGGEALPESQPGRFTILDRQLIQSIVASVTGIDGALDEDSIEDLVEEVLHLNVTRHQTYFHRGFLDLLSERDAGLDFPEANPDRRAWYLAGAVSALARRQDQVGQLALLDQHREHFRPLLAGGHEAVVYALPSLVQALWEGGRDAELPRLTDPPAFGRCPLGLLRQHLERTTDLLAEQEAERAEPQLVLLERSLNWRQKHGLEVPVGLFHTVQRRQAHALRQRGDFAHARQRLLQIESHGPASVRARVQADLGLIDGGFRSLSRIRFPDQRQDLKDLASNLGKGAERFRASAELAGIDGGHGAFCLAMQAAALGDSSAALPLAERAEAFFAARPRTYERGGLLARAQLLLGWALATELEQSRSKKAAECLSGAVEVLGTEGLYLVEDALTGLATFDAGCAANLAQELRQTLRGAATAEERIIDAVAQDEVLVKSPEILQLLLDRSTAAGRTRGERFSDAKRLLSIAEQLDNHELAEEVLDGMQGIAARNPHSAEAEAFLEMLDDDELISTGWTGSEQLEASIALLKGRGDCARAATLLERLAHVTLGQETLFAAQEAQDLVPELEALGVEGFPTPELSRRILANLQTGVESEEAPESDPQLRGRILFLGGNETQARYQEDLRRLIGSDFPRIELEFRHLGWSPNWGRQLDQLRGSLDRADAFVLMRFMRTMCGRSLRRTASRRDIPWIACTGHGRDAIEAAIRRAVAVLGEAERERPAAPPINRY